MTSYRDADYCLYLKKIFFIKENFHCYCQKSAFSNKFYIFNLSLILLSIDIELKINDDYKQTRQFNYLMDSKNNNGKFMNCFLLLKYGNNKLIEGELNENGNYIFLNVPEDIMNVSVINKYINAEFIFELRENLYPKKSVIIANQVNF